jgi:hypothetical protein
MPTDDSVPEFIPTPTEKKNKKKKKGKVSPARTVIALGLLAVFGALAVVECTASVRYHWAVNAVDVMLNKNDADLLSESQVETVIGRSPDGPGEPGERDDLTVFHYSWSSLLRSYRLNLLFKKGKTPYLLSYSTGEQPPTLARPGE